MPAIIDLEKCTGCGDCVEACPTDCIEMKNEKAVVDEELCSDCGICVGECPTEAITID